MDERKRTGGGLVQVCTLLYLIWLIWYMMPPARRKLLLMRAADQLRRLSRLAAAAHGRYGMMLETRGDVDEAARAYETAYQLMVRVHDQAARWYEQARGAIL